MSRAFTGSSVDGLSTLKFLHAKHPQHCAFILERALSAPRALGLWSQVALMWRNQRLSVPGGSEAAFALAVTRCEYSLTVVPLLLVSAGDRHLHFNVIILDRDEGTAELFEPFGRMPKTYGPAEPMEQALCSVLRHAVPRVRLERPQLSAGSSLQARQELEGKMRRGKGVPPGYCMAWSTLYAHMRLSAPMEQRTLLPDKMLEMAQNSTAAVTMTEFIQEFASEMISGDSS